MVHDDCMFSPIHPTSSRATAILHKTEITCYVIVITQYEYDIFVISRGQVLITKISYGCTGL